jgi:fatty-acyl-CoA synthase
MNKLAIAGGALAVAAVAESKLHIRADLTRVVALAPLLKHVRNFDPVTGRTLTNCYRDAAKKWPHKDAFHFIDDNRRMTFLELDRNANQLANVLSARGFVRGDIVVMYMGNRPEFVVTWLAMAKIGVLAALVNYNLKQKSLEHCITISKAKGVLFSVELAGSIAELADGFKSRGLQLMCTGGAVDFCECVDFETQRASDAEPDWANISDIGPNDTCFFIYTSGTTGLPKAAVIKHNKCFLSAAAFCNSFNVTHDDKVYTTLPLYHSAGGMIGVGMMCYAGATLVLRSKFSARNFWKDVHESGATVMQYIGELCRYLLQSPPTAYDTGHKMRVAIGNGLRPDIWKEFVARFDLKEIGEFYGATEGNIAFFNHFYAGDDAAVGAIGHTGYIWRKFQGWKIVQFDVVDEEPVRDKAGFCLECGSMEPGELLSPIVDGDPSKEFVGYHGNKKATESKIMRDVFVKGDKYFRTGDLIAHNLDTGYVFFVDRIGDTFRWKSENVSTTEVSETVSTFPGVQEVNVVGVEVPGKDGRACMAAMVIEGGPAAADRFDFKGLLALCKKDLPSYAVPIFLRMLPEVEITGTFKHRKVEVRKEGIDLDKATDPIYWLKGDTYVLFTPAESSTITDGTAKL